MRNTLTCYMLYFLCATWSLNEIAIKNYTKVINRIRTHTHTHTHTHNHFTAPWNVSGTTQVSWYQKKHSPTHTYRGHQSTLICFLHLLRSMHLTILFHNLSQVFFGLPLGLAPSTSHSIQFFTQSLSSFHNTCPYHRNLFHCSTEIMSSNPSLSLSLSTLYLEFCLAVSRHTSI